MDSFQADFDLFSPFFENRKFWATVFYIQDLGSYEEVKCRVCIAELNANY